LTNQEEETSVTLKESLAANVLRRAMLLAVSLALVPPAALAADTDHASKKPADTRTVDALPKAQPLRTAMANVDTGQLTAERAPRSAVKASQERNPATESPSFFKTRTGMVVLAVVAVGTGYAIYSAKNDRIHSPGKE
jgi:hypothetical protein